MNVYTVTSECASVKCVLEESRNSKLEYMMVGYVTVYSEHVLKPRCNAKKLQMKVSFFFLSNQPT